MFPKIEVPQSGWFYNGNPYFLMDDLGGKHPLFLVQHPNETVPNVLFLWWFSSMWPLRTMPQKIEISGRKVKDGIHASGPPFFSKSRWGMNVTFPETNRSNAS